MFDLGFQEVFLIGIVALVVVGPERLPAVAANIGRWIGKTRRFVAGVKSDFAKELESGDLHKILGDQKEQINELRSIVDSTRKELESSTTDAVASAKAKLDSAKKLTTESLDTTGDSKGSSAGKLPDPGTPVPVPEELNQTTDSETTEEPDKK